MCFSIESSKMDQAKIRQNASLSDYLAAERTFLAWIRTGLALMGFGFVVARFGLFLA
jgi:putative membrane protein